MVLTCYRVERKALWETPPDRFSDASIIAPRVEPAKPEPIITNFASCTSIKKVGLIYMSANL